MRPTDLGRGSDQRGRLTLGQEPETQGQPERADYFVDQNGKPFFYLADTCWLLFQRLDHDELDEYLKDRVAKGFTVIQAYVIRGLGRRHPDGNSSLLGESPFIDRDATRPNEAFFKNVDYVVNRANELGLVMGLVTAKSWHVNKTPEQVFTERNAYTFGKFLGQRYRNNAVIWYPGGDSVPGKDDAVWVAMAKGLRDGCGGTQLISYGNPRKIIDTSRGTPPHPHATRRGCCLVEACVLGRRRIRGDFGPLASAQPNGSRSSRVARSRSGPASSAAAICTAPSPRTGPCGWSAPRDYWSGPADRPDCSDRP